MARKDNLRVQKIEIYLHCYYSSQNGETHVTRSANRYTTFKEEYVFVQLLNREETKAHLV